MRTFAVSVVALAFLALTAAGCKTDSFGWRLGKKNAPAAPTLPSQVAQGNSPKSNGGPAAQVATNTTGSASGTAGNAAAGAGSANAAGYNYPSTTTPNPDGNPFGGQGNVVPQSYSAPVNNAPTEYSPNGYPANGYSAPSAPPAADSGPPPGPYGGPPSPPVYRGAMNDPSTNQPPTPTANGNGAAVGANPNAAVNANSTANAGLDAAQPYASDRRYASAAGNHVPMAGATADPTVVQPAAAADSGAGDRYRDLPPIPQYASDNQPSYDPTNYRDPTIPNNTGATPPGVEPMPTLPPRESAGPPAGAGPLPGAPAPTTSNPAGPNPATVSETPRYRPGGTGDYLPPYGDPTSATAAAGDAPLRR